MVKRRRKVQAQPYVSDEPHLEHAEVFAWAKRMCECAKKAGCSCSYKQVNVFTEFTGSTCAESAVESVINSMDSSSRPAVQFKSMADIKQTCRDLAMATRT